MIFRLRGSRSLSMLASMILGAGITLAVATAVWAAVNRLEIVPVGNSVIFYAHSTGHDFEGKTSEVKGTFGCDRENVATTAYGEVAIPVRNLRTGIAARDKEMFKVMNADAFPVIRFKVAALKDVRWSGSDTFTATAQGTLTIHGITRTVPVALSASYSGTQMSVTGTAKLRLTDFSIKPPSMLFIKMADEVRIGFRIKGKPTAAQ